MTRPTEEKFESHFCDKLGKNGYRKRLNQSIDLNYHIDEDLLVEFLEKTQPEELNQVKNDVGNDWLEKIKKEINKELKDKKLFEVLKEGINVYNNRLKLIYFEPETTLSKEERRRYESNIFSYVRQYTFKLEAIDSIDIVLFLNGIALITIELKSQWNGQVVDDAVYQYIQRDKNLQIFKTPILHIASDTEKAKVTTHFKRNSSEDFVWFNKDVENPTVKEEYAVEYLYNEILLPKSLIEIIEHYLYCFYEKLPNGKKIRTFFFPRYHQRRTVINLNRDIAKKFKKDKKLNLRYLIQHSAGSGKSYTISVLQKFLRYMHIENKPIFDSIIILTDRVNLDSQLKGTISASETQQNLIEYVEKTPDLAKALNKNTKVIITTIQKFSVKKLNEILERQKDKKICFIIDEAHRSQSGKLHKNMVGYFEPEEANIQEELISGIGKRTFPNCVFVALTATPSGKTINMFGQPFDVYSMDQAEQEDYILNVSENIITYNTLYQLSHKLKSEEEFPPLIVAKKLKNKAYEDEGLIKNKLDIILKIFDNHTKYAIKNNSAKAMIVTSSRKAAVKYKLILDEILKQKGLNYKSLVAFTGSIPLKRRKNQPYTEVNMNNIKDKIEEEFKNPEYRFLIVANKFQYGFNQPLLHTMFLDKSISGINAVQTISRLNRIFPNKHNTLAVDFTNSYNEIIKAFKRFKKEVNDYSGLDVKELPRIYQEILKCNIFTKKDVEKFKKYTEENKHPRHLEHIASEIKNKVNKKYSIEERRTFRSLLNKFNNTFKYLNNLLIIKDIELNNFALFSYYIYNYLNPLGKSGKLDEELNKVFLRRHKIKLEKTKTEETKERTSKYGGKKDIRYTTVKEVVESINSKFELTQDDNEKGIIEDYMNKVIEDDEIKSDLLANKGKDMNKIYRDVVSKKLKNKFINYFISNNTEKVSDYLNNGIDKFINFEAFRLTTANLGII